ncbi:MAG TPA: hypothetical protein VI795_01625 [Patescibacteria group bacterium]|nr:hypothetical protein [Patescibacteria group bacterium]
MGERVKGKKDKTDSNYLIDCQYLLNIPSFQGSVKCKHPGSLCAECPVHISLVEKPKKILSRLKNESGVNPASS